jgi:hypothetical protein
VSIRRYVELDALGVVLSNLMFSMDKDEDDKLFVQDFYPRRGRSGASGTEPSGVAAPNESMRVPREDGRRFEQ